MKLADYKLGDRVIISYPALPPNRVAGRVTSVTENGFLEMTFVRVALDDLYESTVIYAHEIELDPLYLTPLMLSLKQDG